MTILALDASKYTDNVTPALIQRWRDNGCGLVIVQSHPAEYGQQRSLDIMRALQAAGMPWDAYIYGYLAYPDWTPGALATLDLAAAEGLLPRKLWLDVEDVDSGKTWSVAQRVMAVYRDLTSCDGWLNRHGNTTRTAIYSAAWYWNPYMGGTHEFGERQLWAAQYDGVADAAEFTPFGAWESCRIKQYAGSQPDGTDLDVLSEDEEAELTNGGEPPVDDTERAAMQEQIDSLINSLGYLAGDMLAPVVKQKSKCTKAVQNLVAAIRAQAEQQGINHA